MSWYYKKWFVWLMVLLFFPVGVLLMWMSPSFGTKTRVVVTAFFVLVVIGAMNRDPNAPTSSQTTQPVTKQTVAPAPKQYAAVDANTLIAELERNAAAANKKYKGQLVCVTGRIGVIDSDGNYILIQNDNEFSIIGITCHLDKSDKSQENFLMSVQKGQYVRVYGEITDVGEVIGYAMKVDKFE